MENISHKTIEANQLWFPLDNAAKIYPAIRTDEFTTVFRLTAVLNHAVKIKSLMKVVSLIEDRFPYYKVLLKQGFFWYYLEHVSLRFPVEVDDKKPCRKFGKNSLLIRILVRENRISVEFSHILTDGSGAFEFLKTILVLYTKVCGATIPDDFEFCRPADIIPEEEYEDSYNRYFRENIPPIIKKSKAFHIPWPLKPVPRFDVRQIIISLNSIKTKASEKGVSITDYLVSVYLCILQHIIEEGKSFNRFKKNRPVRVQVPINLRNIFPSKTMRNFSLFVLPEIDLRLGHYSFDQIIKMVHHQIRLETDEKLINKNISRNVGSEKKIYVKSIPLLIKSLILRLKYYSLGTSQYSGVITNLGKVKLPPETEKLTDYFIFIPPPPNKMLKINCGIIGFRDKLVMSFGNITRSEELEEKIIDFLKNEGVDLIRIN